MSCFVRLLSKNYFILIRKLILHFALKISGYKNFGNFKKTGEEFIINFIASKNIKNCLDIGAHTGSFSKKLLEKENIRIIAFEAMKENFKKLKKLEKNYQNFHCFNIALSNIKGISNIYFTNVKSQLSSIEINLKNINFLKNRKIKKKKIKTDTLDNFVKNNKYLFSEKIDFIKIDTEGHDYKILVGAKKFIKNNKPKFIQIEMNYHYLFAGENLYQFKKLLVNYEIYQIMPFNNGLNKIDATRPENNIFHLSNFLFIRK